MNINQKKGFNKYAFIYIAIVLAVISCNTKQSNHPFANFNIIIQLENGKYPVSNDFILYQPQELIVSDSLLIILDIRDANSFIKIYDKNGFSLISSWGVIGKGPNEFLGPGLIRQYPNEQTLWFFDMPKSILYCLEIHELLSNNKVVEPTLGVSIPPELMPFWSYHILSDSTIIIPNGGGTNALLTVIDFDGNILKKIGVSPLEGDATPMGNYFYSNLIEYNPNTSNIACFYNFHEIMLISNIKTNEITEIKGLNYKNQIINIHPSGNVLIDHYAFSGVKTDYKYLFTSYLGRKKSNTPLYTNEILVFTWELEPIAVLELPNPIIDFDIYQGEIYAIIADSEDFSHLENPIQKFRIELNDE